MGGGAWCAAVYGVSGELDTTGRLHFPFHFPQPEQVGSTGSLDGRVGGFHFSLSCKAAFVSAPLSNVLKFT